MYQNRLSGIALLLLKPQTRSLQSLGPMTLIMTLILLMTLRDLGEPHDVEDA